MLARTEETLSNSLFMFASEQTGVISEQNTLYKVRYIA